MLKEYNTPFLDCSYYTVVGFGAAKPPQDPSYLLAAAAAPPAGNESILEGYKPSNPPVAEGATRRASARALTIRKMSDCRSLIIKSVHSPP